MMNPIPDSTFQPDSRGDLGKEGVRPTLESEIQQTRIPANFFFYWTGQDFQYIHYLCVLSLLSTSHVERCDIYYEEAPRENPHWENVKRMSRVRAVKLDFEELIRLGGLDSSDFREFFGKARINHRSDLFRYLMLYCHGGIYLDFDILLIKDLAPLCDTRFFVGMEKTKRFASLINGAVMGAVAKHEFLAASLAEVCRVAKTPDRLGWGSVGPNLLTSLIVKKRFPLISQMALVLLEVVGLSSVYHAWFTKIFIPSLWDPRVLRVYPKRLFYFFSYQRCSWKKIFLKGEIPAGAYLIHIWGGFSQKYTRTLDEVFIRSSDSIYAKIARQYLPPDGGNCNAPPLAPKDEP